MELSGKLWILIGFSVFVVIPSIIMFSVSFSSLQATEVGLDYNQNTKTVDPKVYANGLYFLGLGHGFITFPTTLQTVDFEGSKVLTCFTSDGLPVVLSLSFQYKLSPGNVYQLYMTFGSSYETVFKSIAIHNIAYVSTLFSAYQFFNEPSTIGAYMLKTLQDAFLDLYASVEYFQLKSIGLPQVFEEAIQDTIVAEQQIQKAGYQLQTTYVLASTMVQNATYFANITLINAAAEGDKYYQIQAASALATANMIDVEATSYQGVMTDLEFTTADQLLDYIWFETLTEQDQAELFINFPTSPVMSVK